MMLPVLLLGPWVLLSALWACAALWIDGPALRPLAAALGAGYAVATALLFLRVRPFRRGLLGYLALFGAVLVWWFSIPASNDLDWEPGVARLPRARFDGDVVTLENVRNFDYRTETDFDEIWETRSVDLSKLVGLDISLTYWGSPWIAHTIMSWEFTDSPPLAISIETRKQASESYSALLGFFRQFELYYVVADERDLIRLRPNYRGENTWLYHMTTPLPVARALLLDYLRVINELNEEPRWYNAATHNCTTAIRHHVDHVAPGNPWDWRILVNGVIDEMGYERGSIDTSLPFEELRERSNIDERSKAADEDPRYSQRIREGLPGGHR